MWDLIYIYKGVFYLYVEKGEFLMLGMLFNEKECKEFDYVLCKEFDEMLFDFSDNCFD